MKAINVEDLPEPIAQALDEMVRTLREQLQGDVPGKREPVELPTRRGKVIAGLSREEIYEDAG